PVVWAGTHALDLAVASALRWGLATSFVIGSGLVWWREELARLAGALILVRGPSLTCATAVSAVEDRPPGTAITSEGSGPPVRPSTADTAVAQTGGQGVAPWAYALLAAVALVVLLLTTGVAVVGFGGRAPSGPLADSLFAHLGWTLSNVGPLALLTLGLVGTA